MTMPNETLTLWDKIPTVSKRMPEPRFFNTNKLRGDDLADARKKNDLQNEAVLKFFQDHPLENWTPYEVYHALRIYKESSVRRAITQLTNPEYGCCKLVKTDIIRNKNHAWRLR
jgi:hypothetical protein